MLLILAPRIMLIVRITKTMIKINILPKALILLAIIIKIVIIVICT